MKLTYLIVITACLLISCSMPVTPPQTPPVQVDGTPPAVTILPAGEGGSGGNPTEVVPTADPNITPTAIPDPPVDWVRYESPALGIAFYTPPEWEVIEVNEFKLDVRQPDGEGWLEINLVTGDNTDESPVRIDPAMLGGSAQDVLLLLLTAAQEDGTYEAPHSLITRTGQTAWITGGVNDVLEDRSVIGVIGGAGRVLIAIGHAPAEFEGWSELAPLYEQIIWTIEELEG